MRKRTTILTLFLAACAAAPADAHDHQWCYDHSEWAADLCRGRELAGLIDCDPALLASAQRQFAAMDEQTLMIYTRGYRPPLASERTAAAAGVVIPVRHAAANSVRD
jgi:hypothetical protein